MCQPPVLPPTSAVPQLKLDELRKEKTDIERYHVGSRAFDYGPADVFLPFAGRCVYSVTGAPWLESRGLVDDEEGLEGVCLEK